MLALPEAYRNAFRIVESGNEVNLPNLYHSDGRGYFLRSSKTLGEVQGDAIRNITGCLMYGVSDGISGAFYIGSVPAGTGRQGFIQRNGTHTLNTFNFDASRVVPTANENRPLNIGFTPAIYLGV